MRRSKAMKVLSKDQLKKQMSWLQNENDGLRKQILELQQDVQMWKKLGFAGLAIGACLAIGASFIARLCM